MGTTKTMTTTTGSTGGRENADNFAGYVNKDDDDDPIGGRGAQFCPRGNAGGGWRRRRRRRTMTRGWQAVTMTVGRARTSRGGRSTPPFFRPLMAWDDGRTTVASTAVHNN